MKGNRLKVVSVILCAIYVCMYAVPFAFAVEPLELHMEGVTARDGELRIYCNTNSEAPPQKDNFSVTLGNTVLGIKTLTAFEDAGASFMFLVDVSGSIRQSQLAAIKETITLICDDLSEKDNISICAIGNEAYTQPFVSNVKDVQAQIDAIERSREDTNLYDSVSKALSILNTHESCRDKKALVIFSDGEEDSFRGITIDEAAIKIKDSHIPIYTIAMLGKNPASRYVETAKTLGSFARLSAGGRHYIHTLDNTASETVADDIMASIRQSLILTVDLSGFHSEGNAMDLRIELTVSGQGTAGDSYPISTSGLSTPEPSATPQPSPSPSPDVPEEEVTVVGGKHGLPPTGLDWIIYRYGIGVIWIAGGAAALLLAGIVLFIVLRRKKPSPPPPAAPIAATPVTQPIRPPAPVPPPGKPRIALRLTKIGLSEEQVYRAEFAGILVIGRDSSKAALAFKDDDLLSGRHCSISYESDGIVLRDLGSTNKTFVNGVPIYERHVLENDDILLIGSMELRINWESIG